MDNSPFSVLSAASESVDGSTINSGTQGTQFNIGFLSPSTGPLSGATALQTEILTPQPAPDITTGTVYFGNASPTNISLSATSFSAETLPAANSGVADFTVVLPDGSLRIMPEDFSYGPTIVEVSTNASTADGGAQGVVFGYGLAASPTLTIFVLVASTVAAATAANALQESPASVSCVCKNPVSTTEGISIFKFTFCAYNCTCFGIGAPPKGIVYLDELTDINWRCGAHFKKCPSIIEGEYTPTLSSFSRGKIKGCTQ